MHAPHPNTATAVSGHSADVQMYLHVNGTSLPVVQACATSVKLKNPINLQQGSAVLEIIVDGEPERSDVEITGRDEISGWITIKRT